MTLPALTDQDAQKLLTAIHTSMFAWRVEQVPITLAGLGWTVVQDLPGEGQIADPGWSIPDTEAMVFYGEEDPSQVDSITVTVTSRADGDPQELDVADVFARLAALAAGIFGIPGERAPGDYPRLRWYTSSAAVTIDRNPRQVKIIWARRDFQQLMDEVGRP